MECEIKILLDKLIEFITDPAWLSVILSLISTIAVIVIARVQIRLQKQQTKAQEYKLYSELYDLIYNIDRLINNFLHSLYAKLCANKDIEDIKDELDDMRGRFYKTERDLMRRMIDFQLKTPNGRENVRKYQYAIILMANLTSNIHRILQDANGMRLSRTEVEKEYRPSVIASNEIILKSAIVSRVVNQDNAERMEFFIDQFLEVKDEIIELNYTNEISKFC